MKIAAIENRSRYTVETAAIVLKRFYFLQCEAVLMQAGWLPGVASQDIKNTVGHLRAQATPQDRAETEKFYERILAKGRSLASAA